MEANKKPVIKFDSVVIDCENAESLANFYANLLNWQRRGGGDEWAAISDPAGKMVIYFQTEPDYVPPVWPA